MPVVGRVLSVQVGAARPLRIQGREVLSAYGKRPVPGGVSVGRLGLDGDEQADPSVHGGLSKAVYAYPFEHYAFWRTVRAQARVALWDEALPPGALGENLTLTGLTEAQAWIGDVLKFPDCALAISEPRYPCFKFEHAMGFRQSARLMAQSGYCGFYLAVREEGTVRAGDAFELVPGPREVSIAELFAARMRR